ncbi:MAG: LamG domain-containing protein [Anaerolineae bacterium]|nr:LamG domain-containing protein [Anaerolineae bacterium]
MITLNGPTSTTDRQIYLLGGNVCVDVVNGSRETICSADATYNDNQWHMVAQTVGPDGHKLYIDGKLAASGIKTSSGYAGDTDMLLGKAEQATGTQFTGLLDEVKVFPAALTPAEVNGLYRSWSPVTVAQTGAGVLTSAWSTQVPAGLEGPYEIDLTATDTLGNRNDGRIDWNHWQGEIDTASPRVSISVSYSGAGSTARTTYTGYAEDLNLTEANLQFPCQNPTVTRTYNTLTRPGEPQRLNRIDLTCSVSGIQAADTGWMRVCDTYDHCVARQTPTYRLVAATDRGIVRVNPLDGSELEILVPASVSDPTGGLAFDTPRAKMYWVSGAKIMRANLDGTAIETVLTGLTSPRRVALNSGAGKLYWNEPTKIKRANLDGSGVETLYDAPYINPPYNTSSNTISAVAVDPVRGQLYWSDKVITYGSLGWTCATLWHADLDGQNPTILTDYGFRYAFNSSLATRSMMSSSSRPTGCCIGAYTAKIAPFRISRRGL